MIFDTHSHYNLEPLLSHWQKHWQDAQAKGVVKTIVVGTDIKSSPEAVKIATSQTNMWASVAVHPLEINSDWILGSSPRMTVLAEMASLEPLMQNKSANKIVAVGETGLDYFHLALNTQLSPEQKTEIISKQKDLFSAHINLAQKYELPLIIHVRDKNEQAYWDVLEILKQTQYKGKFTLHCASGPIAYIQQALEMGAYVGFAGNVTYKNADNLRQIARMVPQDKILLETDAPYLPPQKYRGQTCEPWMINETVTFLEQELGVSQDQTYQNAYRFFEIKESKIKL